MERHLANRRPHLPGLALALAAAILLTLPGDAAADRDAISLKLQRQSKIMEMIVNDVLKESPNLLVSAGEPAHALYLEEFGFLICFEASLVDRELRNFTFDFLNDLRVRTEDGNIIIWNPDDEVGYRLDIDEDGEGVDLEELDDEDLDSADAEARAETSARFRAARERRTERWERAEERLAQREHLSQQAAREAEIYERGKQELIDTVLDYGDTMTALRDDQWVGLAAFLGNADIFQELKIGNLVIKARMRDLAEYAEERIDRAEMRERLVIEEY